MKSSVTLLLAGLVGVLPMNAGSILLQNLNADEDAAHGLFDSSGALISGATTGNLRLGYFSLDDAGIATAWSAGDIVQLNASFTQYGLRADMQSWEGAYDGLFQTSITATSNSFAGMNVYLFASTGADFTDRSAEYLIYKFDVVFQSEPFATQTLVGTSLGSLLVGGYGHFSYDYDLGGGALPGFNTLAVVPEFNSYALMFSAVATMVGLGRRSRPQMRGRMS